MKLNKSLKGIALPLQFYISQPLYILKPRYPRFGWVLSIAFLFIAFSIKGQPVISLKIGDYLPEVKLKTLINSHNSEVNLSDYRGKYLLIDFWATWCTSCLHHFPVLDSIQRKYGDRLNILLVDTKDTRDTPERITHALNRFKENGNSFILPTAYYDTVLNSLFSHFEIPHVVWIDTKGKVRSITSAEEVTENNLLKFFDESQLPAYQKKDFDPRRPLYTDTALPINALEQYSIFLKGKTDGIGQGGLRRINDTVRGLIAHNQSLYWIYSLIKDAKIPGLNDNRMVLDVKDISKIRYVPGNETKLQWEREHDYSYELIVPKNQVNFLYDDALSDLNKYTDYLADIEERKEDCWILKKKNSLSLVLAYSSGNYLNDLESSTNARLFGSTLFDLCLFIDKIGGGNLIVLDETGISNNIHLDFGMPIKSLPVLIKQLSEHGLTLQREKRTIPMMVIHDKPYN